MTKEWLAKIFRRQVFIKYVLTGLVVTAGEMALLYALVNWWSWWYLLASTTALFAGIIASFFLRKILVFKDKDWSQFFYQLALYTCVFIFTIALNGVLMYLMVERGTINYLWAQIISNTILGLISFLLNRVITFKPLQRAGLGWQRHWENAKEERPPEDEF